MQILRYHFVTNFLFFQEDIYNDLSCVIEAQLQLQLQPIQERELLSVRG